MTPVRSSHKQGASGVGYVILYPAEIITEMERNMKRIRGQANFFLNIKQTNKKLLVDYTLSERKKQRKRGYEGKTKKDNSKDSLKDKVKKGKKPIVLTCYPFIVRTFRNTYHT